MSNDKSEIQNSIAITNPTIHNGFAFRIPPEISLVRANCHKDWGKFVTGDTKGMNILEATEAKLVHGNWVEMAMCSINNRILTFQPHYINEQFTEIWGIPVAGGLKDRFPAKASELLTFLLHRQSKDKLQGMVGEFSRDAFSEWVEAGMEGDSNDFAIKKASEVFSSKIFKFSFVKRESTKYGGYHAVVCSSRDAVSDFEKAALEVAGSIHAQAHIYCVDQRRVENEIASLNSMPAEEVPAIAPAQATQKVLKGSK